MAKIKTLKQGGEILYPRTSTKAVLDDSGNTVESLLSATKSTAEANKTAISGSGTYDATKGTVQSRLTALEASSGAVEVDTTLSVSGKAADAKTTGDKVQEVAQSVTSLNTSVTSLGTTVTGLNTSVTNMDTRVTALESAGGGGGTAETVNLHVGEEALPIKLCAVIVELGENNTIPLIKLPDGDIYAAEFPDGAGVSPLWPSLPINFVTDESGTSYTPRTVTLYPMGEVLAIMVDFTGSPSKPTSATAQYHVGDVGGDYIIWGYKIAT